MPFEPAPSNGEGVVWCYFISQLLGLPQVSLRLRHFLKPEAGFPGSENELGVGATLREAKGIVGALCKSRTPPPPTDGSSRVLAPKGHARPWA